MPKNRPIVLALALGLVIATSAFAQVQPERSDIAPFRDSSINITTDYKQINEIGLADTTPLVEALAALGVAPQNAYIDVRSNRWGTLMPVQPLIPGDGAGNTLDWQTVAGAAPRTDGAFRRASWQAFVGYLDVNNAHLRIDTRELATGKVTVHGGGDLVQIWAPRVFDGVPVRDSYLTATVNSGNLILFGATKWGDITTSVEPAIGGDEASDALGRQLDQSIAGFRKAPFLNLVPTAIGSALDRVALGAGYGHRLAWVLTPNIAYDGGQWEALIDAHTGELFALQDLNQYGAATRRKVQGGVYPVSNDGIDPDGIEQSGWPMGWSDVAAGAEDAFTDAGGNLEFCVDGTITSTLNGLFMSMNDNCGAISHSTGGGTLDFGSSTGTDCVTPGFGGPGNTHASRSGFFEMNQIKAQARGQLPANTWPQGTLTANMNINNTCNAFWDGSTVNFYRSGGGCNNTGELAGVFDHEWGHGMDNFDANPTISFPGEGTADIYAALRLNDSCMGRNFRATNCAGYGDPCTMCTGVRDIDWAKRASGIPHTVTWVNANCGGGTHCSGAAVAEAVWDLFNRDLTDPPFNFDHNTALELATRLSYLGAGVVGTWWTGAPPFAACNGDGGYLNYLAADDDGDGIGNGTPHMSAIFDAFNRHEAACATPVVANFGCAGGPSTAPGINSVTAIDKGAAVDFSSVAGADHYDIFRTDGVFGCDQGKIKVGSIAEPADEGGSIVFYDVGAQNGREYWYTVIAVGSSDACTSPASTCTAVTPANGPNLALDTAGVSIVEDVGDEDGFVDNCEELTATFDVNSFGTGTQTNVRIVSITAVSHPTTIITTSLPNVIDNSLPSCASATASISFQPRDMSPNDTFEVEVGVTSDQLTPNVKTGTISIGFAESDLQSFASKTFTFETDEEGWTTELGTFDRDDAIGGAQGTDWYEQSSAFIDQQCDVIRSPAMVVSGTSTLSLWNHFRIEPMSGGTWYDRANIGIVDTSDARTLLTPDGGRPYNADSSGPGTYGGCNEPEEGWADVMPTWAESTWSATAFGSVAPAGLAQLEVIYGTDPAANDDGFRFDQVTVTDIDLQVDDTQSNACSPPTFVFSDGFESGDTTAWSNTVP